MPTHGERIETLLEDFTRLTGRGSITQANTVMTRIVRALVAMIEHGQSASAAAQGLEPGERLAAKHVLTEVHPTSEPQTPEVLLQASYPTAEPSDAVPLLTPTDEEVGWSNEVPEEAARESAADDNEPGWSSARRFEQAARESAADDNGVVSDPATHKPAPRSSDDVPEEAAPEGAVDDVVSDQATHKPAPRSFDEASEEAAPESGADDDVVSDTAASKPAPRSRSRKP